MKLSHRIALTFAAGALLLASSANAQVYNGRKWNVTSRAITTNNLFYDYEKAAIVRGMNSWNNVGANFRWVDGGYSDYAPGLSSTPACDSQSGIDASTTITGMTGAGMRQCSSNNVYTDVDLLVNQDMLFNGGFYTGTGTPPSDKADLQSISVHEFGHGLGLAHDSYSTSVVMYPSIAQGQVRRNLHSRDQNGMRTLYPAP